jgi:hypothetical protein
VGGKPDADLVVNPTAADKDQPSVPAAPETNGDTSVASVSAPAATAVVAVGGGAGKGSSGSGGGDGSDEPVYTDPPTDALIRGWGLSDWKGFANVTKWSVKGWKAQMLYWKTWFWEHRGELWKDCLIGFAVALAQVPEAIAFAFVAGMPPIVGLYGTIVLGFFASLFGGRPGMISGTSGAVGVVQAKLISEFNDMSAEEQLDTFGTCCWS